MGAIISSVKDVYYVVETIVTALLSLNNQWQTLSRRAHNPPARPSANPTSSYWQDDPPFPHLVDVQDPLPATADVVIVGSGITAVAAARTLLELGGTGSGQKGGERGGGTTEGLRVVVCEARQLCSGATGRNGGHVKLTPYDMFAILRKGIGEEKAVEAVRFMARHLEALMEVGAEVEEAEMREVNTVDLFIGEEGFEKSVGDVMELRKWIPELECVVWRGEEARQKFGVNEHIAGAISYRAGALWPYRLITGIWNKLAKQYPDNLILSTDTAVEAVTTTTTSTGHKTSTSAQHCHPHIVKTSRGTLQARHVLHATNGFASYLIPSLRGLLAGERAHMTAQRPGDAFPSSLKVGEGAGGDNEKEEEWSWSVIHGKDYEYAIQRPRGEDGRPGDLMVGGAFFRSVEMGMDQFGVWDDSAMEALTLMTIQGSMSTVYEPNWGEGGRLIKAWSGTVGLTGDLMPFVGRVATTASAMAPGGGKASSPRSIKTVDEEEIHQSAAPGQWVSAGYNGEGMVWAWLCGTAVAVMMLGREDQALEKSVGRPGGRLSDWFPRDTLGLSKERMKRADLRNLAGEVF